MSYQLACFTVIALTHLGFAGVFLFLNSYRRSRFLQCFAFAWILEAARLSLHIVRARGVTFSDRWFAGQDILYLAVTWLLVAAAAHFVGRRRPGPRVTALYVGVSAALVLVSYELLRPEVVHAPGAPRPELFYPVLVEMLVLFIPGAAARFWIATWFVDYWRRTRMPGALILTVFCVVHALGSLSVPLQWYFSFFPEVLYLTWFIEVLGVSVGVVMLSAGAQHAELVLAERKYQLFFEKMADAALLFDQRERCLAANPLARERLNLQQTECWLRDLFEDAHAYLEFRGALVEPAPVKLEARLRTASGETFPASISGGVHYGVDGTPRRYFLTFDDITERRRAAAEREEMLRREQILRVEAEAASRLKDEFLATVSHELRTPLNAIVGWTSLLRAGRLPADQAARALETIDRSARAQNRLIEGLLDITGIVTGKLQLDLRPVAPASIVEAAVDAARPDAEARRIGLRLELAPDAGEVWGDPQRLHQIVSNLLSNAIKFTPDGGRVGVRLERADSSVAITVSDSGQGIAPEFLPYVFERFRQQDGSSTRQHGGLGLGLAIVRHLVELHGGAVRTESAGVGRGAAFTVTLPVYSTAADAPAAIQRRSRSVRLPPSRNAAAVARGFGGPP